MTDERGVATAVGKLLEVGIVVLYVAALTTTLYGSVVPDYRTAAADELGERVLAKAAYEVEGAVPSGGSHVTATIRVALPETIRGDPYRLRAADGSLHLDHPHPAVGGRVALVLPPDVARVTGEWDSSRPAVVEVRALGDATGDRGRVAIVLAVGEGVPA